MSAASAFSPPRTWGGFGDGGAITTDSGRVAETVRKLRNYGSARKYHHEIEGVNSRLDEMQAALLSVKLRHLEELTAERVSIAQGYLSGITNPLVVLPLCRESASHVFHLFVVRIRERNRFQAYLSRRGIDTQIHYPIPPHKSNCYEQYEWTKAALPITEQYAGQVLSLPLYNGMTEDEIGYVIRAVNEFE